jgi:hypothetical protein
MSIFGKSFLSLFVLSGICLAAGSFLTANESSGDPMSKTPFFLIAGAALIGAGLAALYLGIKLYIRHRAELLHIRRPSSYTRQRTKRKRITPES